MILCNVLLFPKVSILEISIKAFRISGSVSGSHLKAVFGYPGPVANSLSCRISNRQTWSWSSLLHTHTAVLPNGCHIKLLYGVTKKQLDPAKNLVTRFQLKSAESSEILPKNMLYLRWTKSTCKVAHTFLSCIHFQCTRA